MKQQQTTTRRTLAMMTVVLALFAFASARAQTTWSSATDGLWTNGAAWSAGVPNANTANLTPSTASYTVTVDATPATPYGNLNITTVAGRTTRLNINVPDFTSTNGLLVFGRGSEVFVNNGGVMKYTGTGATANPTINIKDGGLWRIEGGTVDFSNMVKPPAASSQIYIGDASTGRLQIASGLLDFRGAQGAEGTNTSLRFSVGRGTGGRGYFDMTGGLAVVRCFDAGGTTPFYVGEGERTIGEIALSNSAMLIVSNWLMIGGYFSTGTVTIANNATFRWTGRLMLGAFTNSLGTLTLRDNAFLDGVNGNAGFYIGSYDDSYCGGRGVLNIESGRASTGNGVALARARKARNNYGEANLSGGEWILGEVNGYGVLIGFADSMSGGRGQARVNVTGGLLDLSRQMWNDAAPSVNGLVLGYVSVTNAPGATSLVAASGEFYISDGTVTNSGQFILGGGPGGTGTVVQTGGIIRQGFSRPTTTYAKQMTIGWGGGSGNYRMAGGSFESAKPIYVGGLTVGDLGYAPKVASFTNNSFGTLRIEAGSFSAAGQNLFLGRYGNGTLIIGSNGTCTAQNLILTNNTQSTLRFELGASGLGTLTASGALNIYPGAKLEVDTTAYTGGETRIKLADCTTRNGSFDPANITVTGKGYVRQDLDADIYLQFQRGTMLMVR